MARARRGGFTLVEMLVTLTIIGTLLALVSIRLLPDDRGTLAEEARRLAVLLEHARDESVATGRSIGWTAEGTRYRFWRRDRSRQREEPVADETLRPRVLAAAVTVAGLQVRDAVVSPDSGLVFSPSGLNAPFRIVLAANDLRVSVVGDAAGRVRVVGQP